MLSEKVDYAKFLTWFIENWPQSAEIVRKANETKDAEFWGRFR